MLVTMTFSLELLFAACFGLSAGYYAWFMRDPSDEDNAEDVNQHVTSNPCCEFMEEESRELPGGLGDDGICENDDNGGLVASQGTNATTQLGRRRRNGEEATELLDPLLEPRSAV